MTKNFKGTGSMGMAQGLKAFVFAIILIVVVLVLLAASYGPPDCSLYSMERRITTLEARVDSLRGVQ